MKLKTILLIAGGGAAIYFLTKNGVESGIAGAESNTVSDASSVVQGGIAFGLLTAFPFLTILL